MLRRLILLSCLFPLAVATLAGAGYLWVASALDRPLTLPARPPATADAAADNDHSNQSAPGHRLEVMRGDTLGGVLRRLEAEHLVPSGLPLRLYVRYTGRERIHAGEYALDAGETPRTLLDKLERGLVIRYQVTFPEGWTFTDWLRLLHQQPKIRHTLAEKTSAEIADLLAIENGNPEGWLAPDTYQYIADDTDLDLLRRAVQRTRAIIAPLWEARAPELPYQSAYEALIMASIIEKETGVAAERAEIAGVFVRRLLNKMPLQTDPTVIYGLGGDYQGNLTRDHLQAPSPYNTYLNIGLPPTPIANPGADAIRAAFQPAAGTALYFVARGDGSHQFSATLAEHLRAVRHYQLERRRADYRSAPANP